MNLKSHTALQYRISEFLIKLRIFRAVINWPSLLVDYFNLHKKPEYKVTISGGYSFMLRSNTSDKWSIHEIILRDDYKLKNRIKTPKVIVDLGANIGVFSIYSAMMFPTAQVFSYEPEENNFNLLIKNIRLNNLEKRVFSFQLACADIDHPRYLSLDSDIRSHSVVNDNTNKNLQQIKTINLQQIIEKNAIKRIDILKMDIEGSEYEVFYTIPPTMFEKIGQISMEYHDKDTAQNNGVALKNFLNVQGFNVSLKPFSHTNLGLLYAINKKIV